MSCLLFDLAIEPLACALRASGIAGFQIPGILERLVAKLFADDTTVYMGETDNYNELQRVLDEWCLASRARFNGEKSECMPIGTPEFREAFIARTSTTQLGRTIPPDVRIARDGEAIRSLGGWIGNDIDLDAQWINVLGVIKKRLETWEKRKPTMYGRTLAVSMDVGGRTQYLARVIGMPEKVEKRVNKMILDFVWKGDAHPRIGRDTLFKPLGEGGLGLIDIEARNEALDLVWLREYLDISPSRP
ncbi:hypothetical protein LXA43DRAFT_892851, partial [Ganoderma leucocontextum]